MSLINDALKKSEQLRTQDEAAPLPPTPGGGAPVRTGGGGHLLPQVFLLIAFGVGALIAIAVLLTVYLLRRPEPAPVAIRAPAAMAAPAEPAPAAPAPATAMAVAPTSAPATRLTPAPAAPPKPEMEKSAAPAAIAVALPPPLPAAPLDPTKPDPRIVAFVDALRVAGVRIVPDGNNKVLMNDRVYRQNELVDQLLGVRLKAIAEDKLTFTDERGVVYTRNF